jgi:hypothetical protein
MKRISCLFAAALLFAACGPKGAPGVVPVLDILDEDSNFVVAKVHLK